MKFNQKPTTAAFMMNLYPKSPNLARALSSLTIAGSLLIGLTSCSGSRQIDTSTLQGKNLAVTVEMPASETRFAELRTGGVRFEVTDPSGRVVQEGSPVTPAKSSEKFAEAVRMSEPMSLLRERIQESMTAQLGTIASPVEGSEMHLEVRIDGMGVDVPKNEYFIEGEHILKSAGSKVWSLKFDDKLKSGRSDSAADMAIILDDFARRIADSLADEMSGK